MWTRWKKLTFICGSVALSTVAAATVEWQKKPEDIGAIVGSSTSLDDAIRKSTQLITQLKDESGAPGIVVGVSVDGKNVWQTGFGYADLENTVPCTADTVMRIASISKSITMATVAKYWEMGKLDLDKPVHEYVPNFPRKTFKECKTFITSRHLASHQSGIRHYKKLPTDNEMQSEPEFLLMQKFDSLAESLKLFQDDPLHFEPGTGFLYTTHGWTLLSAVLEEVSKVPFQRLITDQFKKWGMRHTYLDTNEAIIYNRSKYYLRNKKGTLENAPYVNNSCKWAGGGFLSTVGDLLQFGNIMLYCYQFTEDICRSCPTGYLKRQTVDSLWLPSNHNYQNSNFRYGLGWGIIPQEVQHGGCEQQRRFVFHDGGAVGASSTLMLLLPADSFQHLTEDCQQKGVVVAIMTNLGNQHLNSIACDIARIFEQCS